MVVASDATGTAGVIAPSLPDSIDAGSPLAPIGGGGAPAPVSQFDAGGAVDPNTVTLKMDAFTVRPSGEVFMCQDFARL